MSDGANAKATTFYYEKWRAISSGVLETAGGTFLLLIAVKYFDAGAIPKALVATGGSAGMLLTPLVVHAVSSGGWTVSRAAAFLLLLGGAAFTVAAIFPSLPVFVAATVFGMVCAASAIPLYTQMYQDNYPSQERGRLFSRTVMIRIAATAIFAQAGGKLLSIDLGLFQWLLLVFAIAYFYGAFCLARCPTRPLVENRTRNPFQSMRYLRDDRVFRWTIGSWMLMGFGNLMMLPMRVEYLANPRYGLELSAEMIAFLVGVVPNVARLILNPLWGYLFDRLNFFLLRIMINLGFAIGIIAFFTGETMVGLVIGAIIFGISNAGGDLAWSLWVTKVAKPERVADYMAIHVFFTGVRGLAAPIIAFQLAKELPLIWLGGFSSGLILLACLLLLPEVHFGARRKGVQMTQGVSE